MTRLAYSSSLRRGRIRVALVFTAAATALTVGAAVVFHSPDAHAAPDSRGVAPLLGALPGLLQVEVDHSKIQGSAACGECHAAEVEAWKKSTHSITFQTMHKKARAKEITDKLALKGGIKRNDVCLNCHYTAKIEKGKPKPISGVSCESCHGAAADWIGAELHHGDAEKAEGAARLAHLQECEKVGMLRPANVYRVAKNCYSCHTVPNETLVNVGGHNAGSDFELVSWSQGEVRHNYQYSDDKKNRAATTERKRVLFVVGALTDLEISLRALSNATAHDGVFYKAMSERVKDRLIKAHKILKLAGQSGLRKALPPAKKAVLDQLVEDSLAAKKAADKLSPAIFAFAERSDGTELAALDDVITAKTHGTAQP